MYVSHRQAKKAQMMQLMKCWWKNDGSCESAQNVQAHQIHRCPYTQSMYVDEVQGLKVGIQPH